MELVHGNSPDNVVRKQEFLARHPEWSISCDKWGVLWQADRSGIPVVGANSLGSLLNKLETLTGERGLWVEVAS